MASSSFPRATRGTAYHRLVRTLALGSALALGVAAASAQSSAPAPASAVAAPEVKDAWIRWLPSGLPAGGYLTLVNRGDLPLVLVGASSEAYADIELHHSLSAGGMTRMLRVNRITVAAHSTLSFADAGYHLMLMQPSQSLSPGNHVPITLHFAGGGSQTVQFEVRKPDGSGASTQDDMHGMPGMEGMKDMKGMPGMPH